MLAFILAGLAVVETKLKGAGSNKLNASQATFLINRKNALILDIRSSEAFKKGHILGAKNLPKADHAEKLANFLKKNKSAPILIVCDKGMEAPAVMSQVKQEGREEVYSLAGGISEWQEAQLPLER